ncbi:P1 family peptidase [Actinoplanes sp. LDG1-06]|uniref:P1 family peptidase n=1 Tax=Paractinoplanes ovalisporus TaxID=2810368 RepID=A0ABS2A9U8_9ACTN|nr:P1 family peptidase [Actinoplanes ovalisporus]
MDGVRVGHTTLVDGDSIRTGITAVVPPRLPCPAGLFVGNGYGKMVGTTQVTELGEIETPVLLTATLSTFRVADALVTWMLRDPGRTSVNPVVAETNDGYLSDIRARPITEEHVLAALDGAAGGAPLEGAVGAGTGTGALGFKGGIGTASRVVGPYTVGVIVQSNFSGVLRVLGVPVPPSSVGVPPPPAHPGNSCVIVVATDGPFDARQLGRIARRAIFAMDRAGSDFAGGSGDYALAFSTSEGRAPESAVEPAFAGVLEAVEEALLNSLIAAPTTVGFQGHIRYGLPHDRLLQRLRDHGVSLL